METSPCEVRYPRKCTRRDVYDNHQNRWLLEKIIKLKKKEVTIVRIIDTYSEFVYL